MRQHAYEDSLTGLKKKAFNISQTLQANKDEETLFKDAMEFIALEAEATSIRLCSEIEEIGSSQVRLSTRPFSCENPLPLDMGILCHEVSAIVSSAT